MSHSSNKYGRKGLKFKILVEKKIYKTRNIS